MKDVGGVLRLGGGHEDIWILVGATDEKLGVHGVHWGLCWPRSGPEGQGFLVCGVWLFGGCGGRVAL